MNLLFTLLLLAVLGDLLLAFQIVKERELFKKPEGRPRKAVVLVPLRGEDPGFDEHVQSLLNQDHPDYEVYYIVDSDEAEFQKQRLSRYNVKYLISERECERCSGKVNAIIFAARKFRNRVIAIADSDTVYPKSWLKDMTSALEDNLASTTFTWPKPLKLSLSNLIRAGFWTFGFESQALGGRFLYGGSMAFQENFFDDDVLKDLADEWCDDCALTRIVKEKKGSIGYVACSMPLNVFDERELWLWSKKEAKAVGMYSRKGVYAFIIVTLIMAVLLSAYLITFNFIYLTPYLLWIVKNIMRGVKYGINSLIPALMSIPALYYSIPVMISALKDKNVYWRGKVYTTSL